MLAKKDHLPFIFAEQKFSTCISQSSVIFKFENLLVWSIMENAGSYNHYHHLPVSTLLIPMTEKLRGSSFSRSHRKYR